MKIEIRRHFGLTCSVEPQGGRVDGEHHGPFLYHTNDDNITRIDQRVHGVEHIVRASPAPRLAGSPCFLILDVDLIPFAPPTCRY